MLALINLLPHADMDRRLGQQQLGAHQVLVDLDELGGVFGAVLDEDAVDRFPLQFASGGEPVGSSSPVAATGTLAHGDRMQQSMLLHAAHQHVNGFRTERPKALRGNVDARQSRTKRSLVELSVVMVVVVSICCMQGPRLYRALGSCKKVGPPDFVEERSLLGDFVAPTE